MSLRDAISQCFETLLNGQQAVKWRMPDVGEDVRSLYRRIAPFTMTSPERISAVGDSVRYVAKARVPGAYVECGVWRGGSSMAAAASFIAVGDTNRELHLFDTFEGMSAPSEHDLRAEDNVSATTLLEKSPTSGKIWCRASIEDVTQNMASTGYPMQHVHLHKGRVEDTLPGSAPEKIAILRLDTDWYESTKHELETLYPRLSVGGVLIIDDYGYWAGARKAVDEFFKDVPVLLNRIDRTGRIAVKTSN